jgi:hypothetical protein
LYLKRADVDAVVHDAVEAWAALIIDWWRCKVWVACVNGWTAG